MTLNDEGESAKKASLHHKTLQKFLLVGCVNSGACTIFKQVGLVVS